jgi:hypothetical protein
MKSDGATWLEYEWQQLTGTTPPFFPAMPAQVLQGPVKLAPVAELKLPLRDEREERRRLLQAVEELRKHADSAGVVTEHSRVEWRPYADETNPMEGPTAVLTLTLRDSTREMRRDLLLNLLERLAEHRDPLVRARISVRVR